MSAGAMLFAMTTARGTNLDSAGRGGFGQLSKADVAGSLAWGNLGQTAYLLGLVKYCGHTDGLPVLSTLVYQHSMTLATRAGLTVPVGKELLRYHAIFAVCEVVGNARCPQCAGSGDRKGLPCFACQGAGELRLTERAIAGAVGIPRATWQRRWKPHYVRLTADLECWADRALSHVYRYTREGV